MNQIKLIENFALLGERIRSEQFLNQDQLFNTVEAHNPWFTASNTRNALLAISDMLQKPKLETWLSRYNSTSVNKNPKTIGLVLAGNIPLVGFHDFLCVLITGNTVQCKLSSKDNILFKEIINILIEIDAEFACLIDIKEDKLSGFDAIIATGSDNSARYFNYYFGKYPNIIRKNRNSIAVLSGNEDENTLQVLGDDIFSYFGLGCRNVSKLFVPQGYDFTNLFTALEKFNNAMQHTKYFNNYEYNRSIYLVNKVKHLDNGFLLVKEDKGFSSPIGVLYYQYYTNLKEITELIETQGDRIQCVVSSNNLVKGSVNPGEAQLPELWDYADNVDTIDFLLSLNK